MPTVFVNGQQRSCAKGTTFESIVSEFQGGKNGKIVLVYFNGKMRELSKRLEKDGVVTLITTGDPAGHQTYERTAVMMLVKAARDLAAEEAAAGKGASDVRIKVEFTLGTAFFCSVQGRESVDDDYAAGLQAKMREITERNAPIIKKTYPIDDGVRLFAQQGMEDKIRLFHFRRSSTVNVYNLEGFYDYYYGYMCPSAGYVDLFEVKAYQGGLLLNLPSMEHPDEIRPFYEGKGDDGIHDYDRYRNLFDQLILSTKWGQLVDISTIGDLNEKICEGNISDMILVQEALQERRISDIAEQIYNRKAVKFVLIAGPSSSGKTTFAHRLSIQLRSFGLHPHIMSMDNWFVNREKTPVDIDGNYNFDVIEALDLDLFNDNLSDLLAGEEVELPTFNFKKGKREYKGDRLRLGDSDILVIEGIHGLNPRSSAGLPDENKFKIYISAMTSLTIDMHNRISTSDTRLIRRMIRDARTRGNSAQDTIRGWKKVREGEEKYIFPFQQDVDAVFNSVLIYEQAVLKQFAEPLLFSVPSDSKEYYEAKRLLKFLDYILGVDTAAVPSNSICREFVGGGCFGL